MEARSVALLEQLARQVSALEAHADAADADLRCHDRERPTTRMTATPRQLLHRIATLEARRAAPTVSFPPLQTALRLGYDLDPWQRSALTSTAQQTLWNIHRQGGKSSIAAILALCEILNAPDRLVLVISPTERQWGLLFRTLWREYRRLGSPIPALAERRLAWSCERKFKCLGAAIERGWSPWF